MPENGAQEEVCQSKMQNIVSAAFSMILEI